MATAAQLVAKPASSLQWFWEFLKEELRPYPGRVALVARVVVATTVVMILTLVFQLPYGAYGAIFAVTLSRENPETTVNAAKTIIVAFALSVLYVLVGATLFLLDPLTRFFWVIGTFFLMFYALRVVNNYTGAARYGYIIVITIPLWDEHLSSGQRVENTLWAFGVISLASIIAALTELVYANLKPQNDLFQSIAERLATVEELLARYSETGSVDGEIEKKLTGLALVGTSRMRRFLRRSNCSPHYAEQMGAVLALVGRLVDIAANLTEVKLRVSGDDRARMPALANRIAGIRTALLEERIPSAIEVEHAPYHAPLLQELEVTASQIPAVFAGYQSLSAFAPQSGGDPPSRFLVPDAFTNPEHLKFALRGCLAASLCYLIYNAKDWPGITTSVTTCFLTALSTIGSSHQKQILRIAGAIIGGLLLGLGAQIFVLPYLDSVTGFTLLFLAVTIPAVWIATSGPRLSYLGVQILVAFYLINLSDFAVQTSLVLGRDRVIGIFLGLLMMWLAFDQLWASPAAMEMKKVLVSNLRLLAQFAREPVATDSKVAIERGYALREQINQAFDGVRAAADGVLFEFGPSRNQDLAWRGKIKERQPQLRLLFITEIALWKYRAQLPGFELPESIRVAQRAFDGELARALEALAGRIEGQPMNVKLPEEWLRPLVRAVQAYDIPKPQQEQMSARFQAFLLLNHRIESLATSLQKGI